MRATKAICDSFGLDSSSCLHANVDYNGRCNELGESDAAPINAIGTDVRDLASKDKKALIALVTKFHMAYALANHAAQQLKADLQGKLKACQNGQKDNKLPKPNSKEEMLKKAEQA